MKDHPLARRGWLAAAGLLFAGRASAQATLRPNKLVMQVSDADPGKWSLTLHNAYNVLAELGPETVEMEIVVYGPAIDMLKRGSPVADRVASAIGSGVRIVACENTMTPLNLTLDDLLPKVGVVTAGVVELMQKQQQGWAYVRP